MGSVFLLSLLLIGNQPLRVAAQSPTLNVVDAASDAFRHARFEEVVRLLGENDLSSLPALRRADALFMLGAAELALADDALSQKAFIRLFSETPTFSLPPYTSPKIAAACERAKKQVASNWQSGGQGPARVEQHDSRAPVPLATTPIKPLNPEPAASSSVTTNQALPLNPNNQPELSSPAKQGTPWYKHWLTWAIVAVVIAGGAAATTAVLLNNYNHEPGSLQVNLAFPSR